MFYTTIFARLKLRSDPFEANLSRRLSKSGHVVDAVNADEGANDGDDQTHDDREEIYIEDGIGFQTCRVSAEFKEGQENGLDEH